MSKAIEINAAQQIRWGLGIDFPLFTSRGEPRSRSHTKKGPGRRAPTPAWERVLRAIKRTKCMVDVVWPTGAGESRYCQEVRGMTSANLLVLRGIGRPYTIRRKGNNLLMDMAWGVVGVVRGVARA